MSMKIDATCVPCNEYSHPTDGSIIPSCKTNVYTGNEIDQQPDCKQTSTSKHIIKKKWHKG